MEIPFHMPSSSRGISASIGWAIYHLIPEIGGQLPLRHGLFTKLTNNPAYPSEEKSQPKVFSAVLPSTHNISPHPVLLLVSDVYYAKHDYTYKIGPFSSGMAAKL